MTRHVIPAENIGTVLHVFLAMSISLNTYTENVHSQHLGQGHSVLPSRQGSMMLMAYGPGTVGDS